MFENNIILVGVDGATWNVINPLMRDNKLPTFKYLVENGACGILESFKPLYTPIIWTSIATGKKPQLHGIKTLFPTRYELKTLTIWDILENLGRSIGLFNWPVTWPPRPVNGFTVPGWLAKSPETFPTNLGFIQQIHRLRKEDSQGKSFHFLHELRLLLKAIAHGLSMRTTWEIVDYLFSESAGNYGDLIGAKRAIMSQSIFMDLFENLYKDFKPEFCALYLDAVDTVAHLAWGDYQPSKNSCPKGVSGLLPQSYFHVDKCLGRILSLADKETLIVVVSDHGTKSAKTGETVLEVNARKIFKMLGIHKQVDYFKCDHELYFSFPGTDVDENEIVSKLRNSTIVGSETKLFRVLKTGIPGLYCLKIGKVQQEEYNGAYTRLGDLTIKLSKIATNDWKTQAIHDKNGIFIAYGPRVRSGERDLAIRVTDVMPSLLYYLDLPVGRDVDGRVIKTTFVDEFIRNRRVKYIDTYDTEESLRRFLTSRARGESAEERDVVLKRLRRLGYL